VAHVDNFQCTGSALLVQELWDSKEEEDQTMEVLHDKTKQHNEYTNKD